MTTATPRIEISRPGRFTATDGKVWDFSEADLAAAAAGYDGAGEPAPLVVGHPQMDAPAYGWVKSLVIEGGKLVASPDRVNPDFAEAVKAGSYRRVSASWYPPAHPQNPKPGIWYLKHVGFLGAAAPAIRGLSPVHFSEAQLTGAVTIDLSPEEEPIVAEDTDTTAADFAEREAELDTREQGLAAREAALQAKEALSRDAEKQALVDANVAFAEGLVAGGKLKPFGKGKLVGLMNVIASTATAEFGEAGELAPLDVFKEMLTAADPFVSFGAAAPAEDEDAKAPKFAAPPGFTVDAEALVLHGKAHEYQAAHPEVSYLDAVKAVS